ncbi:MAG: hypothetical protein II089_09065 [Selenomonas sp.]|nr:hypothetical protein [Selenomonas sp.]
MEKKFMNKLEDMELDMAVGGAKEPEKEVEDKEDEEARKLLPPGAQKHKIKDLKHRVKRLPNVPRLTIMPIPYIPIDSAGKKHVKSPI